MVTPQAGLRNWGRDWRDVARTAEVASPGGFREAANEHSLDENAAENVLRYLEDQQAATQQVPATSRS